MIRYTFIFGLLTAGVIASGFMPVLLPSQMVDALVTFFSTLMMLNEIVPVTHFIWAILFLLLIEIAIFTFKMFKWIIG